MKHAPRSIEDLEARLKKILSGDESAFSEAAAQIDELVNEATPYKLRHGIDSVIKVVEGKHADVVLMHATIKGDTEDQHVIVHPVVAGYYNRTVTIKLLEDELECADRRGDWDRAAAVAEATIQVFDQRTGHQPATTDRQGIKTGRLGRARPELEKRLTEAYANARR